MLLTPNNVLVARSKHKQYYSVMQRITHNDHTPPYKTLTVQPRDQQYVSLGQYTAKRCPKGFTVTFTPEPEPRNSAVSQIVTVEDQGRTKFVLQVANFGTKPVTARVWKI